MKTVRKTYSRVNVVSSIFMIIALLWLTVSTPFVYASQQALAATNKAVNGGDNHPVDEEESNPLGNSTEEKTPGSVSLSEEYLHSHHSSDYYFHIASRFYKLADAKVYVAFHGEMLVPPPNPA
jgi:hypothetical protein